MPPSEVPLSLATQAGMPKFGLGDQNKQRYTEAYQPPPTDDEEALEAELRELEGKLAAKGRPSHREHSAAGGGGATFKRSYSVRNEMGVDHEIHNLNHMQSQETPMAQR